MYLTLDQRVYPSKNLPSSIQRRWTLKATDLNSVVYLHMSKEQYLPPPQPWTLMVEEPFSTIWEGDSVFICWCRKWFRGYRKFWRKAYSGSVLPQHGNWCHPIPIHATQTVCQHQECGPKVYYQWIVPCNHQPATPDSWQGKLFLPIWRCWKRQPQ